MQVVSAVTAALYHRERSGEGQEIEVPMFETMVYYTMAEHLWGMTFEPPIGGPGYTRLMSHHRKPYKTLDGYIAILPVPGRALGELLQAHRPRGTAGRPALHDAVDPRDAISTTPIRRRRRSCAPAPRASGSRSSASPSVPTNMVNTLEDLKDDPHLKAVGFWQEVDHPTEGRLRMTRFP